MTDVLYARAVVGAVMSVLLAAGGYRKKSLNKSGAFAALFVGFITCLAGFRTTITLLLFFFSSSYLTKLKAKEKRKIEENFKEGGQRNWVQVVTNGGTGTLLCLLYICLVGETEYHIDFDNNLTASLLLTAFLGHYACCNGDTWASEVGVLSSGRPLLLTTGKRVPKGTNGGVSALGYIACLMGGLFLGIFFYLSGWWFCGVEHVHVPQWPLILLGAFAGVVGSTIDSLLGAWFQYSGFCENQKKVVSRPGPGVKHITGIELLTNEQVNFLSALLTSLLTAGCAYYVM